MIETIELEYQEIPGAIDQAKFLAQQHFNNNGMGWKAVFSAVFVPGGIACEYDESLKPEEEAAIEAERDEVVYSEPELVEEIGPTETIEEMKECLPHIPPMQAEQDPGFQCQKCGKEYDSEYWYKKHIAKCK